MAHRWTGQLTRQDVTPEAAWLNRRQIIGAGLGGLALAGLGQGARAAEGGDALEPNSWDEITSYNNYYEFGTGKEDPAKNAHTLTTEPWTVKVDGLVSRPAEFDLDDLLKPVTLEERIYRLRCVEGWSMVIPWVGFPLSEVLNRVEPLGSAKFLAFETVVRPDEMPGLRARLRLTIAPTAFKSG